MKIEYSPYVLQSKEYQKNREGALLRVHFNDGSIGYADCHPWPELGDKPVKEQLAHLRKRQTTTLTRCSLHFARIDASARQQKKSLLRGLSLPLSHFLIMNILIYTPQKIKDIVSQGYTHVKIKLGQSLAEEIAQLIKLFESSSIKLRFDFNEKLSKETFYSFLKSIEKLHHLIDYIEDPVPFNPVVWKEIREAYPSIRLACDRQAASAIYWPEAASLWIIKPAIQNLDHFHSIPSENLIVTAYLDHPIGQLAAAYVAAQLDPKGVHWHGLLSHHSYETNIFSQHLSQQGPQFITPAGYGFGYDEQLAQLDWQPL